MLDKFIKIIAPHLCYMCRSKGALLCDSCIYNITQDAYEGCLSCHKRSLRGVCPQCVKKHDFSRAWIVSERKDELKRLLDDLKFQRCYEASLTCARLLHEAIPMLPSETIVTYIPTIPKHVRVRGYDHAALIARHFASRRRLACKPLIKRNTNSVQLGSNRAKRKQQAREAFYSKEKLIGIIPYLIIDDIVTTGATLRCAATALKSRGAQEIWVAAVAKQPLETN